MQNRFLRTSVLWGLSLALLMVPALVYGEFYIETNNGAITITGYRGPAGSLVIPSTINGLPVTGIQTIAFEYGIFTSVIIPNSITNIGAYAFDDCESLTNVIFPTNLPTMGEGVLEYCTSLTGVTLPNNAGSISQEMFFYCLSLANLTIPNTVTNIGIDAFEYCVSLTNVTIPDSVTTWIRREFLVFSSKQP